MKMLIGDRKWQRWLSLGGLVVIIGSCFWMPQSAPAEAQAQPTAIVTPVHVPSTPTPVSLPAPTGEAIRVNFPLGSYGTAIFGTGSQRYLLWAKAGQAWNLHQMGKGYSNLIGSRTVHFIRNIFLESKKRCRQHLDIVGCCQLFYT